MSRKNYAVAAMAAALCVASYASNVSAQTIIYETSFEAPEYAVGALSGQNSWLASTSIFQVSNVAGAAATGTQFVLINSGGIGTTNGGARFAWRDVVDNQPNISTSGSPILQTGVVNALIAEGATPNRPTSTGVQVYNIAGTLTASLLYTSAGQIAFFNGTSTVLSTATVPAGQITGFYHALDILVDYSTGSVGYFFNGSLVGAATTTHTDFGDTDLFVQRSTAAGVGTVGYFSLYDDLYIATFPVPEPGSMALLAPAAGLLARRRRA